MVCVSIWFSSPTQITLNNLAPSILISHVFGLNLLQQIRKYQYFSKFKTSISIGKMVLTVEPVLRINYGQSIIVPELSLQINAASYWDQTPIICKSSPTELQS